MFLKKILLLISIIIIVAPDTSSKINITLTPEVGVMGGKTEYEMDYILEFLNYITYPPVMTTWRLNSLLEFPLDTKIGGLSLNLYSDYDPSKWNINIKYLRSLSDPNDKMKDSDWEGFSTLFPYTKFSYTESDAEMNLSIYEAEVRYRVLEKDNYNLSILIGGRYQQIEQDIIGFEGWYRPFDTVNVEYFDSTVSVSGAQDTIAMDYKLQLEQFRFGLHTEINFSEKFTTQIKVALAPIFFNDTDNHFLRFKRSTSNGDGMGYRADLNLRYYFPDWFISYIQLKSQFNTFTADGSQMQYFYENIIGVDPNTGKDIMLVPINTYYGGLPHTIRSTQYMINLQLGIEF